MRGTRSQLQGGVAVLLASLAAGAALVARLPRDPCGPGLASRLAAPRVAAHRGGYGLPDQNTVARFEAARLAGADIVETDLRVSSDGVVFLFHDARLDRATGCTGPVARRSAAEIEACRLRGLDRGPERFEAALAWSRGRVVIDAELKTHEVIRPAIDLVRRYDAYEWVYFQVGNGLGAYERVRRYDARVALEAGPRGPEGARRLAELLARRDPRLLVIQLHADFLSDDVLRAVRAAGKHASLNAWQLSSESGGARCDAVFAHGIDIAVTNALASCLAQRDRLRGGRERPVVRLATR